MLEQTLIVHFLANLPAFLIALVVHESAHGFTALKLGDTTAKRMGRLTLNPLAHIDPFGTIILPLLLILTNAPIVFGWAKPVPVNFHNLQNPKKGILWVGLAGPAANFLTAAIIYFLLLFVPPAYSLLIYFFTSVILINIVLGAFNLIPIPPLDGSRILMGLLPLRLARAYGRLEPYGMFILIVLIMVVRRLF